MAKKLVIIDDSATQLSIMKAFFVECGWDVCAVQSAKIGFELIFNFAPDLIITDAMMPIMGGFQLIKLIRKTDKISKIPVIVYSVLNEASAKFYIKEQLSEYFLRKDNNLAELVQLADKIVYKYPLSDEYKMEILEAGKENIKALIEPENQPKEAELNDKEPETVEDIEEIEEEFNSSEFINNCKVKFDFSVSDEKIFPFLSSYLHKIFDYDLMVLCIDNFETKNKKVIFDIQRILLSPHLSNAFLNEFSTRDNVMYKKYVPNMPVINDIDEFKSELKFEFSFREEKIAQVYFYSRFEDKWTDEIKIKALDEALNSVFKTRYIKRTSELAKKENKDSNYLSLNKYDDMRNLSEAYFATIQISNFSDLTSDMIEQEIDVFNSKISEKIISCLEKDEQVTKNYDDGYDIIFFAKDNKRAKYRLEYLQYSLEEINHSTKKLDVTIYSSSANIDGVLSIENAKKQVVEMIDDINIQEKLVIYNGGK